LTRGSCKVQHVRTTNYFSVYENTVKIGSQSNRSSAISASNPETILVRGHDLVRELVGKVSFTDHVWLLVAGAMPTSAQRRVLDATLVAIAEHGLVPSVVASRMTLAAAPDALQGAVAAGILGCGSVILGASEAAGRLLAEIRTRAAGASVREAATAVIGEFRAAGRAIPGYGHPLHKQQDPRALRLLEIASEAGTVGAHCEIARVVEELLPSLTGKPLVMNVSGAIPAVLLDAGFPLQALKGVPILARTASLVAHLLEELERPVGFVMSHAAAAAVGYDGEAPPGFTAASSG
jgi:citrate synthase